MIAAIRYPNVNRAGFKKVRQTKHNLTIVGSTPIVSPIPPNTPNKIESLDFFIIYLYIKNFNFVYKKIARVHVNIE